MFPAQLSRNEDVPHIERPVRGVCARLTAQDIPLAAVFHITFDSVLTPEA